VPSGIRRGELLALRWRDIDLDAGTINVRRSVGLIRVKGQKPEIKEGATKTNKPRVVDIDEATVTLLRAHKWERGGLALALARDQALVFGDEEGRHRHPERFSRTFKDTLRRCGKQRAKQLRPCQGHDEEALPTPRRKRLDLRSHHSSGRHPLLPAGHW
jgi:integrase